MTTRECDMRELRNAVTRAFAEQLEAITTHPGEDELVRYYAGELPATGEQDLQEYLVLCRRCTDRVLELHRIVQEDQGLRAACRPWIDAARRGLRGVGSIARALGSPGWRERSEHAVLAAHIREAWLAPALAVGVAVLLGASALLFQDP